MEIPFRLNLFKQIETCQELKELDKQFQRQLKDLHKYKILKTYYAKNPPLWFLEKKILFLLVNPIPVMVFKVLAQLVCMSMRKRTQVRLKRLGQRMFVNLTLAKLRHSVFKFAEYSVFRFVSKQPVVRQDHVSQEVNSLTGIEDGTFLGVQREFQVVPNKFLKQIKKAFQIFFVSGDNHKVVGIARVMFDLQIVFNELVEFVHVNVGKQLRSEIADRQAVTTKECRLSNRKASDNLLHKTHGLRINYPLLENCQQNFVINRIKKLPHVALEYEARPRIISALPPDHTFGGQHTFVRTFADAARKRISDEGFLKDRIQNPENCMMQNPITHHGLVNVAHFWITNIETRIRSVGVAFGKQVAM